MEESERLRKSGNVSGEEGRGGEGRGGVAPEAAWERAEGAP